MKTNHSVSLVGQPKESRRQLLETAIQHQSVPWEAAHNNHASLCLCRFFAAGKPTSTIGGIGEGARKQSLVVPYLLVAPCPHDRPHQAPNNTLTSEATCSTNRSPT